MTSEQARIFCDKLWRLHIDSRVVDKSGTQTPLSEEELVAAKAEKDRASIPFQHRLLPGMFVRMRTYNPQHQEISMILSPEDAFPPFDPPLPTNRPRSGDSNWDEVNKRRFIVAAVTPGLFHDSWVLQIQHLKVISIGEMVAEVNLEWDGASRYYYVKI